MLTTCSWNPWEVVQSAQQAGMPGGHKFRGKNLWQADSCSPRQRSHPHPYRLQAAFAGDPAGIPSPPQAPPRVARTVEWEFLASGHRNCTPIAHSSSTAGWAEPVAEDAPLEPWPNRGAPCWGRPATALRGQLHGKELESLFGAGGDRAERWRRDGERGQGLGGEGPRGCGRGEAQGAPRNSAAGRRRRYSGTRGEWPRTANVGKQGNPDAPGSGARSPHSPEISAWGTSLKLKPLAP